MPFPSASVMRQPRKLPVVLSADEVVRFLEAIPSLKSRIALTVGLRVSEWVLLKSPDIDSQNSRLISLSAAGCLTPITRRPIPSSQPVTPKTTDKVTLVTSSSASSAAAPCGGSQPCRAHPPISHSAVVRHDLIAADFRHRYRQACCASSGQPASFADRLPHHRLPS